MVTYHRRAKLAVVVDDDIDDLERSMAYMQRRLDHLYAELPPKPHWWIRFLRWAAGVKEPLADPAPLVPLPTKPRERKENVVPLDNYSRKV